MLIILVRHGSVVFLLVVSCCVRSYHKQRTFLCSCPNIQKPCVLVIWVIITVFRPERSRAISDDTERKTFRVFEEDQKALTYNLIKKILWDDTPSTTLQRFPWRWSLWATPIAFHILRPGVIV